MLRNFGRSTASAAAASAVKQTVCRRIGTSARSSSTIARHADEVKKRITRTTTTTARRTRSAFSYALIRSFHATSYQPATVPITFIDPLGKEQEVQAEVGKHLLDVAHDNNIELEGACGGELACATCHLIFEQDMYDTLPEKLDEEDDMLDLAYELTDTSRLGCQITVREDMTGMKVTIPDDGF